MASWPRVIDKDATSLTDEIIREIAELPVLRGNAFYEVSHGGIDRLGAPEGPVAYRLFRQGVIEYPLAYTYAGMPYNGPVRAVRIGKRNMARIMAVCEIEV